MLPYKYILFVFQNHGQILPQHVGLSMKCHVWLERIWYISLYDLTYTHNGNANLIPLEAGKVMNPGANNLRWLTG
jgi:hypothetical protein